MRRKELFFISVVSTALLCVSSFWRQSTLPDRELSNSFRVCHTSHARAAAANGNQSVSE
jgi:hypothetical protein